eukprot:TRINITY_DN6642_c0_g1_i1.p4 TRINITY_DN6642_c0_g1~~TRINITY_DN6642_c0_g1_i1.p4  ORF type:complete len:147 (+),score=20.06 TRINITY_DN6642_c0_g1_i1:63-503(+)
MCIRDSYQTIVIPEDTEFLCPSCQKIYCAKCHQEMHYGQTCEEYREANNIEDPNKFLENQGAQEDWTKCPKCSTLIQLLHGCFHMTCPCKNQFCYTCKTNYELNQETQKFEKKCNCPLFDEKYLLYDDNKEENKEENKEDNKEKKI